MRPPQPPVIIPLPRHQLLIQIVARFSPRSSRYKQLRYACLELRMALEGLVYERATRYLGEIHGSRYKHWQPTKVFREMLEVDPDVPQGTVPLGVGLEEEYGKPAEPTNFFHEYAISTNDLNAHYNALGSFLHTPTIDQLEQRGEATQEKMLRHCNGAVRVLEKVFSSTVQNLEIKALAHWGCAAPAQTRRGSRS